MTIKRPRQSHGLRFWLLLGVTSVVAVYGVVYPLIGLFLASFTGGDIVHRYAAVLGQTATQQAIVNSIVLSIATVIGCALAGVPVALLLDRVDLPGRRVFAAIAVSPMLLPPLVGTIAFIFLYGESGIMTRLIMSAFGLAEAPYRLRGFWAVLAFHVYTIYPFFVIFTTAALKRLDPALEEAARTLGAGPISRFVKVVAPGVGGALSAAALLTFMTSMASFSAPYLFGGTLRVLPLQIYEAQINNDRSSATVLTVILASLSMLALVLFVRSEGEASASGGKGLSARRLRIGSPMGRFVAVAAATVISGAVLLPHATVVLMSFANVGDWTTQTLPPTYTVSNYLRIATSAQFVRPILNSTVMAFASALGALAFGVVGAYVITRFRFAGRGALAVLLIVPWALPGTVLAVQIIIAYGRPTWIIGGASLSGSVVLLPVIYFLRNMPLVLRAAQVNLRQMDTALEGASRSLGASWAATMRRVVLPLVLPGAIAGTLLAFSLALGEFVASIVAYVNDNRPIAVQIDGAMRSGDLGVAAAYGTVLIAVVGVALSGLVGDSKSQTQI